MEQPCKGKVGSIVQYIDIVSELMNHWNVEEPGEEECNALYSQLVNKCTDTNKWGTTGVCKNKKRDVELW